MMRAGYSGTPLDKKLGLRPGLRAWRSGMPASVAAEIGAELPEFVYLETPAGLLDHAHVFTASRSDLAAGLVRLRPMLAPTGMIWTSWPKKASKVPTDITEDVIREIALPLGLVDVKVCAVDEIWSGLKLVVRRSLRV